MTNVSPIFRTTHSLLPIRTYISTVGRAAVAVSHHPTTPEGSHPRYPAASVARCAVKRSSLARGCTSGQQSFWRASTAGLLRVFCLLPTPTVPYHSGHGSLFS
ncbi:hypothetical protein VTK73DRAFT_6197 [Phialemonium thermophilum]|uniref:Uncharacterized protein n=1 Tax=Phialemonium thermophilum TaxID=223376 RepID=A0ABR3UZW0_9PEZI